MTQPSSGSTCDYRLRDDSRCAKTSTHVCLVEDAEFSSRSRVERRCSEHADNSVTHDIHEKWTEAEWAEMPTD